MNVQDAKALQIAPLRTPTDLKTDAVRELSGALTSCSPTCLLST
jgi:hypothetical protein